MTRSLLWSASIFQRHLDHKGADNRPSMLWLATNTIRELGAYRRTLIDNGNYRNALRLATKTIRRSGLHERASKRFTDGLAYTDHNTSGYASSRLVATKMLYFDRRHYLLQTFRNKLFNESDENGPITKSMAQNIAGSGLYYNDLRNLHTTSGKGGIVAIRSNPTFQFIVEDTPSHTYKKNTCHHHQAQQPRRIRA